MNDVYPKTNEIRDLGKVTMDLRVDNVQSSMHSVEITWAKR